MCFDGQQIHELYGCGGIRGRFPGSVYLVENFFAVGMPDVGSVSVPSYLVRGKD